MEKRKNKFKLLFKILLILSISLSLVACDLDITLEEFKEDGDIPIENNHSLVDILEDEYYYDLEDVSAYLIKYERLPSNYISKSQAKKLGWNPKEGNLWDVAPKKVIGGDRFGNREKILPSKEGRSYYECDINYQGGHRNAERLVYSNDGLIFYTRDHYKTFEKIYGVE